MNEPQEQPVHVLFSPAETEAGRLLFSQDCTFLMGAVSMDHMPAGDLSEVSFAGRSNVGKSSLINALMGRKSLARTSNTPGRTQQINFFTLHRRLIVTDLPGYGYARAPKKTVDQWTDLIRNYLRGRVTLRRVCLLIDARHGLKPVDKEMMTLMDEAAVTYQVVFTKCDKVKPEALNKLINKTGKELAKHVAAHPDILQTSSIKGSGIQELRAALAMLADCDQLR